MYSFETLDKHVTAYTEILACLISTQQGFYEKKISKIYFADLCSKLRLVIHVWALFLNCFQLYNIYDYKTVHKKNLSTVKENITSLLKYLLFWLEVHSTFLCYVFRP